MTTTVKRAAAILTALVAVLLVLQVVNTLSGGSLIRWGIVPRSPASLRHIFTAPFIHASWNPLASNLLALVPKRSFASAATLNLPTSTPSR